MLLRLGETVDTHWSFLLFVATEHQNDLEKTLPYSVTEIYTHNYCSLFNLFHFLISCLYISCVPLVIAIQLKFENNL